MKEVTKEEFYGAIGKLNCIPDPQGKYPYTSVYKTPDGKEVGRVVKTLENGQYPPKSTYFLPA